MFQITARANRAGITLAAKQLLKYRTVAKLAAVLQGGEPVKQARAYAFDGSAAVKSEAKGRQEAQPVFTKARTVFSPVRLVKGE